MSASLAAGWARSSCQSVSVVPRIQWLPQGMMNSRLFSVWVIRPVLESIRSRGMTTCTPLEARTRNAPGATEPSGDRSPSMSWISSIQTPAALMVCLARISNWCPDSRSRTRTPLTRSPSRRKPTTRVLTATIAPYAAAVRAIIMVCRASST